MMGDRERLALLDAASVRVVRPPWERAPTSRFTFHDRVEHILFRFVDVHPLTHDISIDGAFGVGEEKVQRR